MKKFLAALVLGVMAISASAQVKSIDVKGNLRHDFGVGVGITADLTHNFELSPSFNYYFGDVKFFHIDADFHYNFDLGSNFTVYPIVGATYYHADGGEGGEDFNKFGIDLGAGVKYDFTKRIAGFVEGKYQWVDGGDDSYFSLGVKIGI